MGLTTIGKLAEADDGKIISVFGKVGQTLLKNARGEDGDPVRHMDDKREMKSIGNSYLKRRSVIFDEKRVRVFGDFTAQRGVPDLFLHGKIA